MVKVNGFSYCPVFFLNLRPNLMYFGDETMLIRLNLLRAI